AGLGETCASRARRHSYQPHTSSGSARKASGVARRWGSKRAQSPVWASRKVAIPLSAETPAPVNTTTRLACARQAAARSRSAMSFPFFGHEKKGRQQVSALENWWSYAGSNRG